MKLARLPYAGGKTSASVKVASPKASTLLARERDAEHRRRVNADLVRSRSRQRGRVRIDFKI